MDKLTSLNDSIEELLKQIHILKKARVKEYGYTQDNNINILRYIVKYQKKYNAQPTALKISKQLNITQATITPMINRLVENNCLERIVSEVDKREKLLVVTEKGIELLLINKEEERKQVEKLISYLGEEDTQESIRLLQKVIRYLVKEEEEEKE